MDGILAQILNGNPSQDEIYQRNLPYVRQGAEGFNTQLDPLKELMFRQWVADNKVPFNPEAQVSDYDMRGFYRALQSGDPRASSSVNPNDNRMHYPDVWKTPYHQTFSQGSQWAGPTAPQWNDQDQLISPGGRIMFDERNR